MKSEASAATALPAVRHRFADFLALTKPRLNSLVVITAGVGYYLGAADRLDLMVGLHVLVGSGLVAGGAAALNQVAERDLDGTMQRTRHRPLAAGRIRPIEGCVFATVLAALGLAELAAGANAAAAIIALATLVSYVAIYTPLKRRTSWATVVGAVPGALPPVIGWAAARGGLTREAWAVFGIVFLWQLPHFHALSWLHRDDFRRAGIPLVAVQDADGRRASTHALLFTAALVPTSLAPFFVGLAGPTYLILACVLGVAFLLLAARFALDRTTGRARALFLGSLVYLPLLWGLLVVERAL